MAPVGHMISASFALASETTISSSKRGNFLVSPRLHVLVAPRGVGGLDERHELHRQYKVTDEVSLEALVEAIGCDDPSDFNPG